MASTSRPPLGLRWLWRCRCAPTWVWCRGSEFRRLITWSATSCLGILRWITCWRRSRGSNECGHLQAKPLRGGGTSRDPTTASRRRSRRQHLALHHPASLKCSKKIFAKEKRTKNKEKTERSTGPICLPLLFDFVVYKVNVSGSNEWLASSLRELVG